MIGSAGICGFGGVKSWKSHRKKRIMFFASFVALRCTIGLGLSGPAFSYFAGGRRPMGVCANLLVVSARCAVYGSRVLTTDMVVGFLKLETGRPLHLVGPVFYSAGPQRKPNHRRAC